MSEHIPGVCNIGPAGTAQRRKAGWFGLVATLLLWGAFILSHTPAIWRLTLFIPACLSAIGFLQARYRFCAAFGFMGLTGFRAQPHQTEKVAEPDWLRLDRIKAWKIVIYSAGIGMAAALLGYYLPL